MMRKYTILVFILGLMLVVLPGWVTPVGEFEEKVRPHQEQSEQSGERGEADRQKPEPGPPEVQKEKESAPDRLWTVAVISDLNGSYGSTEYTREVHGAVEWINDSLKPDLVVSTGDMVAGQRRGLDYAAMWRAFHEAVTDELAKAGIPLAVTPGNHDASGSSAFWEERVQFAREWRTRRPRLSFVSDEFYPFHYAFELGPALFISLDGTQVGPLDDAQRNWVKEVLERNSHKEIKFVYSHLPLYGVAQGREHEILGDEELEALFVEHDVDMMMAGHHHAYYPGKRGDTLHLHTACLGTGQRALIGEDSVSPRNVAVVQFDSSGIVSVEAVESPHFQGVVDNETLPRSIGTGHEKIWRMDVEPVSEDGEDSES